MASPFSAKMEFSTGYALETSADIASAAPSYECNYRRMAARLHEHVDHPMHPCEACVLSRAYPEQHSW